MKRKIADKGYTIVELVIVISIMVIVAGGGLSLSGMIPRRQVLGCSNQLTYFLDKTRTNAMSFKNSELWLHMESEGLTATIVTNQSAADAGGAVLSESTKYSEEVVGRSDMVVSYKVSGSDTVTPLGDDTLVITYDRSNGGFTECYVISGEATQGTAIGTVSEIYINKGRFTRTLKLIKLTGKVTSEW